MTTWRKSALFWTGTDRSITRLILIDLSFLTLIAQLGGDWSISAAKFQLKSGLHSQVWVNEVKTIHAEPGKLFSQLVPFMQEERGNTRKGGREGGGMCRVLFRKPRETEASDFLSVGENGSSSRTGSKSSKTERLCYCSRLPCVTDSDCSRWESCSCAQC